MKPDSSDDRPGPGVASWEEHERDQLETMAAATPAQRLAWLEEAMQLAHGRDRSRSKAGRGKP